MQRSMQRCVLDLNISGVLAGIAWRFHVSTLWNMNQPLVLLLTVLILNLATNAQELALQLMQQMASNQKAQKISIETRNM